MERLLDACGRLMQQFTRLELPITAALRPGLSRESLPAQWYDFPGQMPEEVSAFYHWHNGSGDQEFFPNARLLSLEEALETYRRQMQSATQRAPRRQRPTVAFWEPQWLPIFGDMVSYDEYYAVLCPASPQSSAPVYYLRCDEDDTMYLAYDSLTQMLETLATCYETGAYWVYVDPMDGRRHVVEHREQVAQLTLAQHPQRTAWWLAQFPGAQTVEDLAASVEQPYGEVCLAIQVLRDPRLVPPLLAVVQRGTLTARSTAAHLLGELADPRAIAPLLEALRDPSWEIRLAAVRALQLMRTPGDIGTSLWAFDHPEPAAPQVAGFIQALDDPESVIRQTAAHTLGIYRDPQAVDALCHTLQDPEPAVRQQAAWALGVIRDARAVEALVHALDDDTPAVACEAALTLGTLADTRAQAPLLAVLAEPSRPPEVHQGAVTALGKLQVTAAIPACLDALQSPARGLRASAALALGKLGALQAMEALLAALADPAESVRRAAVEALGVLGDPRAIAPMARLLHDPAWMVRQAAEDTLAQLRRGGHEDAQAT